MRLFTQDQLAQSRAVTSGFIPSDGRRQDAVAAAGPIESELREEIAKLHAQLAALLAEQGRAAEAAAVYADALQGETLGPQAPETVEAIDSLSQLLRDGGDAATAAALRERFGCK